MVRQQMKWLANSRSSFGSSFKVGKSSLVRVSSAGKWWMSTGSSVAAVSAALAISALQFQFGGRSCPDCVCPTCPTCPSCPGAAATPATPATPFSPLETGSWLGWSAVLLLLVVFSVARFRRLRVILVRLIWWLFVDVETPATEGWAAPADSAGTSRRQPRALADLDRSPTRLPGAPMGLGILQRRGGEPKALAPAPSAWRGGILGDSGSE